MLFYSVIASKACFSVALAQGPCILVGFSSLPISKTELK